MLPMHASVCNVYSIACPEGNAYVWPLKLTRDKVFDALTEHNITSNYERILIRIF